MARFTSPALRLALAFGVAVLGASLIYATFDQPRIGIDDANIIFTYARNLAAGEGLVWTPGYERVEGFSTLAWTLLSSLAFGLSPWPERSLGVLSVLLCGVAVAAVLAIVEALCAGSSHGGSQRGGGSQRAGLDVSARLLPYLLAFGWLLAIPGFYAWTTTTLMESALWAALIGLAALVLVLDATGRWSARRANVGLAGVVAAMVLTRPEGLALGPFLVVLAAVAAAGRVGGALRALRRFLPALAVVGATIAGLTLFRLLYFGYPLPNTYYAKVSPDRVYTALDGARYLLDFWKTWPPAALLSLVALVAALRSGRRVASGLRAGATSLEPRDSAVFAVSCVVLAGLALPLAEGGDFFGAQRFFQPFVPLMIVPLVGLLMGADGQHLPRPRPLLVSALSLALVVLAAGAWLGFVAETSLRREYRLAERGRQLGAVLNAALPAQPRPRVAAIAVGGLGFGYQGRVVDLMGLNWTAMAHAPGDRKGIRNHAAFEPGVFWREMPEIVTPILLMFRPETACDLHDPFADRVLDRLRDTRRFRAHYAAGYLDTPRGAVGGYFLRSWLGAARPRDLVLFAREEAVCGPVRE
jgi:arabinofuranosyltransferase